MERERDHDRLSGPADPGRAPSVPVAPAAHPFAGVESPRAVLQLQATAGNHAVARALAVARNDRGSSTSPPAPASDAGAPAAPGSEPPELRGRLDQIAQRYREMIAAARARGAPVAADNLQYFLDGRGGTRTMGVAWLRGFDAVTAAERTNQERFETSLNTQANQMRHGDNRTFNDHWDRMLTGSGELYYASGTSTLTSTGRFELSMIENEVTITGSVAHHWHDPYDWNAGQAASVPGFGSVSDDDGLLMQQYRGARPFQMAADWTQTLSAHIAVGRLWNTKRFTWSGP